MRLVAKKTPGTNDAVVVGQTVGSYRIVRVLGRGGMGVVYEAVHESIGQRAAVKVLSLEVGSQPQFGTSLLDEARAICMVRHPGLVNIFDFNRLPSGAVYIMMEYLEGDSLWQRYTRLKQEGKSLDLPKIVQIARQIASTLAAVHRKSIVHRDLKPENIMLVDDPDMPLGERAKLLDFGIAKLCTARPTDKKTPFGIIVGTPAYMSPEQFLEEELDGQSDVYSLGAVIYEMLAGKLPFEGRTWGELAAKHVQDSPVRLGKVVEVPEALDALVRDMLAKDLHERPVMAQVVDRLDALAEFLRTGKRTVGNETEVFAKVDPEEVYGAPPVDELTRPQRRRETRVVVDEASPELATPAPLPAPVRAAPSVEKATPAEDKKIRRVTAALALATAALLLIVYQADRHRPTLAHTDPTASSVVATSSTPMPVTTPMPVVTPMPITTPMPPATTLPSMAAEGRQELSVYVGDGRRPTLALTNPMVPTVAPVDSMPMPMPIVTPMPPATKMPVSTKVSSRAQRDRPLHEPARARLVTVHVREAE